jgi:hypothetical protein
MTLELVAYCCENAEGSAIRIGMTNTFLSKYDSTVPSQLFQVNVILLCKHTSKFMGANMEIVCLKATLFFCFWMKNAIEDINRCLYLTQINN